MVVVAFPPNDGHEAATRVSQRASEASLSLSLSLRHHSVSHGTALSPCWPPCMRRRPSRSAVTLSPAADLEEMGDRSLARTTENERKGGRSSPASATTDWLAMEGGRDMTCAPHGAPHRRPATATAVLHRGPSAAAPIPIYASRRRGISTGTGTGTGIVVSFPQQGTAQLCVCEKPQCRVPRQGGH